MPSYEDFEQARIRAEAAEQERDQAIAELTDTVRVARNNKRVDTQMIAAAQATIDRLNAILRATAAGLRLPADVDLNAIPAAAASAHDAARNLRDQLDYANTGRQTLQADLDDARSQGYAEAVARLRDDQRYRNWWSSTDCRPDGPIRHHLADYLETVGADVAPSLGSSRRAQELEPGNISSVIAVSNRFANAAAGQNGGGADWVRLRTGSGRVYEGWRSPACPGDGQPGHWHDIRCVTAPAPKLATSPPERPIDLHLGLPTVNPRWPS